MDETFGHLPGVTGIADHIVVYGYDDREHDKNLRAVLQHARETSLRFNLQSATKLLRHCTQIGYLQGT